MRQRWATWCSSRPREKQRQHLDNFQDELQNENFHEDDDDCNQYDFSVPLRSDSKMYDASIKRNNLYR